MGAAPLHSEQRAHRHFLRGISGGEEVAVGPVFEFVAKRVFPVVEYLTAHDVAAHAPGRFPLPRLQMPVAEHQIVEIRNFECGMQQAELTRQLRQKKRMMVG